MEFCDQTFKSEMTKAWAIAVLQRMDIKQFPKSPDDFLKNKTKQEQQNDLLTLAKSLKAEKDREADPKRRRRKDRTFMREI